MAPTDPNLWAQYGPLGLICGVLVFFIFHLMKEHRAERTEWKNDMREDRKESVAANDKLADALRALETSLREKR